VHAETTTHELDEWGWPKGRAVVTDLLKTLKTDKNKKKEASGEEVEVEQFPKWGRVQQIFDQRLADQKAAAAQEATKGMEIYTPMDSADGPNLEYRLKKVSRPDEPPPFLSVPRGNPGCVCV
jgi:hypothetical protein